MVRAVAGFLVAAGAAAGLESGPARAHPVQFAVARLRESAGGRVEVTLEYSGTEGDPFGGRLELSPRCVPLAPPELLRRPIGLTMRWTARCGPRGLDGVAVRLEAASGVQLLVDATRADGSTVRQLVTDEPRRFVVPPRGREPDVLPRYVTLGVEHILVGIDHLLFVLCLLLLHRSSGAVQLRRLLGTITAFTVGHSVTLALASLDVLHAAQPPVEVVIALSIVLLAAELARPTGVGAAAPTLTRRYPWLVAATFGLLHGLGFAGALREVGLPQGQVPLALFGFNVGVELGQLAFVAAALATGWLVRRPLDRAPAWVARLPPYLIGTVAAFWCVQRVVAFWAPG